MAATVNMFSSSSTTPAGTPPDSSSKGGGGGETDGGASGTEPKTPEHPKVGAVKAYFTNLAEDIVNVPPYLGRARVPQVCKWRDKEGLLGEIIDLKDALDTSAIHLAEHRHEYVRRLAENRKLERRVEELELRGNYDAPRTGGEVRLEARVKGLEAQYNVLTDTVAARKHGELYELSRDLRTTLTRETEIERDTYAAETGRLKLVLQHLKSILQQAQENKLDYKMCLKHLKKLIVENPKLQRTVEGLQETLKKAKADIKAQKAKGDAATSALKKWASKYSSLESQFQGLSAQLRSAEKDKHKKQRKVQQVGFDRMQFNRQLKPDTASEVSSEF